jgi:hypothetical protein
MVFKPIQPACEKFFVCCKISTKSYHSGYFDIKYELIYDYLISTGCQTKTVSIIPIAVSVTIYNRLVYIRLYGVVNHTKTINNCGRYIIISGVCPYITHMFADYYLT